MVMKISVSFKNNDLEKEIYQYVIQKMNYSVYIKELVKEDMENNGKLKSKDVHAINNGNKMGIEW